MSARERFAYHEAGHAIVAEVCGLHVSWASVNETGGQMRHKAARTELEAAMVGWAGLVAESLTGVVQTPEAWRRQPDYAALSRLPAPTVNLALERAQVIVSEREATIRMVAEHLMASRLVSGRMIRRVLMDPSIQPRRPRDAGVPVTESFAG